MKKIILMLSIIACVGDCAAVSKPPTSDGKEEFAQTSVIPSDFKLVLRYSAAIASSERDYKSWSLTIPADGKAVQEISRSWKEKNQQKIVKHYSLSQKDLQKIISVIKKSIVFSPATGASSRDYASDIDSPTFRMEVTMDGRSYEEVMIAAPDKDIYTSYGFGLVSSTVLKKIPSPNNNIELKFFHFSLSTI
jgi:hypothetical protein